MRSTRATYDRVIRFCLALALCALAAGLLSAAIQPAFRVIYDIQGFDQPGGIFEGSPGVFYSISGSGPEVAFSITSSGVWTILGFVPNGENFQSLLVSGSNGRFYASNYVSSIGPVDDMFSVSSTPGSKQTQVLGNIVPIPIQNLPDGRLLGVGINMSQGAWGVFTCDMDGAIETVAMFPSTDRTQNVLYATDGNYYGVVEPLAGGAIGYLFRLTPSGTITNLYTFPAGTFQSWPAPLIQAADGNMYGATFTGGANGTGMIYKLTLSGEYTLLYSFGAGRSPHGPLSLVEASDGNLWGVAQTDNGLAYIFRVTKSGQFESVYQMGEQDGLPPGWLIQGSDGLLYGIAHAGGAGFGTVFALDAGLPKPRPWPLRFGPQAGPAGTSVRIWGNNLLSAQVALNGVPSEKVNNSGSNYIYATVPAGATSGPITVTTPGGTFTTKESFTVQ